MGLGFIVADAIAFVGMVVGFVEPFLEFIGRVGVIESFVEFVGVVAFVVGVARGIWGEFTFVQQPFEQ